MKVKRDKQKIALINKLEKEICYREIKRERKGKMFMTEYDDYYNEWLDGLVNALGEYSEYMVFIGAYDGAFHNAIDDMFESIDTDIDVNIKDYKLINTLHDYDVQFNISTGKHDYDLYNCENVEEEEEVERFIEILDNMEKLECRAVGYSQGESMDACIILKDGVSQEKREEIERMLNWFKSLYTITEFTLCIYDEVTKEYTVTKEIEKFNDEDTEEFISSTETEAFISDVRKKEIMEEYQLIELIIEN